MTSPHPSIMSHKHPAAIILGGDHGALSIARSLGKAGVTVYAITHPAGEVRYSRFCRWIELPEGPNILDIWTDYLLGERSRHLAGAVLLAASDEAIEIIIRHRERLAVRFRLDDSNPAAQLCLLDKLCTYRAAQAAGVSTPRFWAPENWDEVERLQDDFVFPLVVKPLMAHAFRGKFQGVYKIASNLEEIRKPFHDLQSACVRAFLVEMIPGPDHNLCSYYTYLDEQGNNLVNFTKRVIRRYPQNMGGSTYHVTDAVSDVQEPALTLFHHVDLRGIGNAEFKLDERDGRLKLIECNARFTAADCLLVASGLNLPLFVYRRITGQNQPAKAPYKVGMHLWKPIGDIAAYRELKKLGLLSTRAWIRSILHRQIFPVFRWNDPLPSLVANGRLLKRAVAQFFRNRALGVLLSKGPLDGAAPSRPTVPQK